MKLLFFILFPFFLLAQFKGFAGYPDYQPRVSYLINEGFEGVGTPVSWTFGNSVNFDYNVSPISGSESLELDATSKYANAYVTIPKKNEVWIAYKVRFTGMLTTDVVRTLYVRDSLNNYISRVFYSNNGSQALFRIYNGTANTFCTTPITNDVVYNVWLHYVGGHGSDGVFELYISTGSSRPSTPDGALTTGSRIGSANNVIFYMDPSGRKWYIDDVRISTQVIN